MEAIQYHVLLIEDNPDDILIIQAYLQEATQLASQYILFDIVIAQTLKDAKTHLKVQPFHVILLDLNLPDTMGVETIIELQEEIIQTPMIILTGIKDEAFASDFLSMGIQDYIEKGELDAHLLLRTIQHSIDRHKLISSLRELSQAFKESQQRTADIINFLPDPMFAIDLEGQVIAWNHAMEELSGVSSRHIFGKGDFEYAIPFYGYRRPLLIDFVLQWRDEYESEYLYIKRVKHNLIAEMKTDYIKPHEAHLWGIAGPLYDWEGNVVGAVETNRNITEQKKMEQQLQDSLEEKNLLLKEIHHRVKNNMQVISSLINLQAQQINHPETIQHFKETQNRVKSMAFVHESLYQSNDFSHVDFKKYVHNLLANLFKSFSRGGIQLDVNVSEVYLNINQAIPCGLILTKLVTNSLKYAFPSGESGNIHVQLHQAEIEAYYHLSVRDNGVGLPAGFQLEHAQSLGLKLVNRLTQQLGGILEMDQDQGTQFTIHFPKKI